MLRALAAGRCARLHPIRAANSRIVTKRMGQIEAGLAVSNQPLLAPPSHTGREIPTIGGPQKHCDAAVEIRALGNSPLKRSPLKWKP
jgi:hypothetical protein